MTATTLPEGFERLDFDAFHRTELPRRLAAGNGTLAADGAAKLGALAFRVRGGGAYRYVPRPGGIDVLRGDDGARTVVELELEDWQGLVHDLESVPGLLYAGRIQRVRGNLMHFVAWEPALRAMFHGRPIFDPAQAELRERGGGPLDPTRTFRPGDDREEMAHFLRTSGYLVVKGVFPQSEIARFREHAERLRRSAVAGDKQSWWGRNARGEAVLCRVTNAGSIADFQSLYADPRIADLATLSDEKLTARAAGSEEGVTVLFKNPDMTEGLSDLPWHRDCGMGGHAVMCPVIIFTICLTSGSAEAGELRVLPGSWTGSYGFIDANHERAPRGVSLDVEAGDVSLHYGDLMHAAPPPTGPDPHRISVLMAFVPEGARPHRGVRSYNDVLLQQNDGQVEHLSKLVDRS